MICLTCNIPCDTICPSCLESVFSDWHNTKSALEFGKKITDEQRKKYYIEYGKKMYHKKKRSFLKRLFNID